MHNLFYFLLLISTELFAIDYLFVPLQYSVGEEAVKSLIESDPNFSTVEWTTKSSQTITAIASGSNVLVPIIIALESALKKALQNTPSQSGTNETTQSGTNGTTQSGTNGTTQSGTNGTTSLNTVLATGNFVKATQAVSLAQSGVFIQAILNLLDFSGDSLFLYSLSSSGDTTFKRFFDVSMLSMSTLQQIIDLKTSLRSNIPILNLNPLSSNDVVRRGNQFRYNLLYGCSGHPSLGSASLKSLYCMPGKVLYTVSVGGMYGTTDPSPYGFDHIYNYVKEDTNSVSYELLVHHPNTQLDSPDYKLECSYSDESNCLPRWLKLVDKYGYASYKKIGYWYHENPTAKCPEGLVFDFGEWLNNKHFQYCRPNYDSDAVMPSYYDFNNLGHYPQFEIYNNVVYEHPYIADQKDSSSFNFSSSPEVSIFSGGQFISYVKRIDQSVSVDIAFQPISEGFFISRTINGLKLLRNGSIEVPLIIRDILKFSNDFKLMERGFSFETQDGFDIAVGSTSLSPKTYGILGKTIAEQFGIRTLGTEIILPDKNENTANESIPCGLGKEIDVLRTRKNAETGKDENYYVKEKSTPCLLNWGKPLSKDFQVKLKGEPIGEQTKEQVEKELSDQVGGFYTKLSDNFFYTDSSKQQKFKFFLVTNKCSPFQFDLSDLHISFLGTNLLGDISKNHIINFHCDLVTQNPIIETVLRIVSMISWFILSLFLLFRA